MDRRCAETADTLTISVGARASPLSKIQVEEVLQELRQFHPHITFVPQWITTSGDKDLVTSLRTKGQDDFFTKEVDNMLLNGLCRIAIHSLKDLPEQLPAGLSVIAETKGLDPRDTVVFRSHTTLSDLPPRAKIGTSSLRREEALVRIRPDFQFVDIRGTIQRRLHLLDEGVIDALVVAECALIRLGLQHLPRQILDVETAPGQGQLAVVARSDDVYMRQIFAAIDSRTQRKKILHLGLRLEVDTWDLDATITWVHHPAIEIFPRAFSDEEMIAAFSQIEEATHLIVTSKVAARLLVAACHHFKKEVTEKHVLSVGTGTTKELKELGFQNIATARIEQQEGVIELVNEIPGNAHVFFAHSSLSRPKILQHIDNKGLKSTTCCLYDTKFKTPDRPINLQLLDGIYFTSPSTVESFFSHYGTPAEHLSLYCRGPITQQTLEEKGIAKSRISVIW